MTSSSRCSEVSRFHAFFFFWPTANPMRNKEKTTWFFMAFFFENRWEQVETEAGGRARMTMCCLHFTHQRLLRFCFCSFVTVSKRFLGFGNFIYLVKTVRKKIHIWTQKGKIWNEVLKNPKFLVNMDRIITIEIEVKVTRKVAMINDKVLIRDKC